MRSTTQCGRGVSPALQALIVLVCVLAGPRVATPEAATQDLTSHKTAYLELLERYAAGEIDAAAAATLELDFERTRKVAALVIVDVEGEMAALRRLDRGLRGSGPREVFRDNLRRRRLRLLKLSLLAHTEAGLRTAAPQQQLLIAEDTVERLWRLQEDFRRNGPIGSSSSAGRARFDRSAREWEAVRLYIRDWHLVVASQLAALGHLASLQAHVNSGLALFKDDPELLLARGSTYELDAELMVVDRSMMRRLYPPQSMAQWRLRLYDARADYERASQRQPDLLEARLRWGRVHALLGETAKARAALDEVARSNAHPFLRYLGRIFLAEVSEQSGDAAAARREYQAALGEWPGAQAPKLGLSRLCMTANDEACGRAWLARSLDEAAKSRVDPWWDYLQGQSWRGDERLASFRARGLTP